jgi:Family of unknown function (DUF6314)
MIDVLLNNKSIEKILFFLLLNGKCYASQLHHHFKCPLTPIQQALQKLEKGNLLISHCEGKTRFYEFNPNYPLLQEVESLLKKAYSHLPPHQKKPYYNPLFPQYGRRPHRTIPSDAQVRKATLETFWEKLLNIQTMCFSAKSKTLGLSGWNGIGKGSVDIKRIDDTIITFHERGTWISEENKKLDFSNVFKWSLNATQGVISLEHLRFGPQNPVFLFELVPVDANRLESLDSHVCVNDTYFGQVRCDKHFIQFHWRVIGPKKNEEIDYLYT